MQRVAYLGDMQSLENLLSLAEVNLESLKNVIEMKIIIGEQKLAS